MFVVYSVLVGLFLLTCSVSNGSSLLELWLQYPDTELDTRQTHVELYQEAESFNFGAERLTVLEIGMDSNRTMLSWMKWFDDVQTISYVGINAKPFLSSLENGTRNTIHIETTPDLDLLYLNDLCTKYGPFDIIVDNSDHSGEVRIAALKSLFPCMSESSHYFIELNMSSANGVARTSDSNRLIVAQAAELFRLMHYNWTRNESFIPIFNGKVKNVRLMHDLIAIERSVVWAYHEIYRGSERTPLDAIAGLNYELENDEILNLNFDISDHSTTIPHEKIKAKCREICLEHPSLLTMNGMDLEECAIQIMQDAIATSFWASDSFLFGDYPLPENYLEDQE